MVLRYQHYQYLRSAVTVWGLTALFVLVRCSVPERDYDRLGIGDDVLLGSAGQGGEGGQGNNLGGEGGLAGQGGIVEDDAGSQGGSGGAPPVPIPCVEVIPDAGARDAGDAGDDAGISDAGLTTDPASSDASTVDEPCACVDGFIRAVDADGDGVGTRACGVAPGLDCDDGDNSVTHNTCGGCSALPNAVGEDCLDCGAYVCDGPEAVKCASKPAPVLVDPDCRCVEALIVARDTDKDGAGTRLCEQSPGTDCNDGDNSFTTNQCGGCAELPGVLGGGCNECGVWSCSGTSMVCVPNPSTPTTCADTSIRQTCINDGFWGNNFACPNVCYGTRCEACTVGTFECRTNAGSTILYRCNDNSSYGILWSSYLSCYSGPCNANTGTCTGQLLLPRDGTFDVVPLLRPTLPWHDVLNTASESDYG